MTTALLAALRGGFPLFLALLLGLGLYGTGWLTRGVYARAELAEERFNAGERARAMAEAHSRQIEALQTALSNLRAAVELAEERARNAGEMATARLADAERRAAERNRQLLKELSDAKTRAAAAGRPSCDLSAEWVRLYDAPLRSGGTADDAAGGAAAAPAGAGDADWRSSGLDEWDVAGVHTENARRWQSCRAQLNELIDWSESLRPTDGGAK